MLSVVHLTVLLLLLVATCSNASLRRRDGSYVGLANKDIPCPLRSNRTKHFGSQYIFGGEIAAEASAPWQVSIQNVYGNHFCGGAIIDEEFVLTAASCVAGLRPYNIKVVTSTNNWMGEAWQYAVDQIIIHCNFDKPLYHNDLALLKVSPKITFDEKTGKIALNFEEQPYEEGEPLTMTGWGSWEDNNEYPEQLKQLEVKYLPYEQCKQAYSNSEDVDVGHLCTSAPEGAGACHGDTGGPLVNSEGELVGIGNWGIPCGRGFPDVFAKVSFYRDWIRTSMIGCNIV